MMTRMFMNKIFIFLSIIRSFGREIGRKAKRVILTLIKSKLVVLLAIICFWTVGSKVNTVEAYSFGAVYQHYLLGSQTKELVDGNSGSKVPLLGSVGSGGASGEFSYDDIINSADEENKERAKEFVSVMATYSTFNYFSNKVEGFSSIIPFFIRAILGLILLPLALLMDILTLIIPTMVGLIAKLNVIKLLATSIEGSHYTSDLSDMLGITPQKITKFATALMSFAIAMIILTIIRIFKTDTSIDQRQVSKLKGRLITLICFPLVLGIGADFLTKAMEFSSSLSASSDEFSRYLIDDRSWAYNFNFAPNGNDSDDGKIAPSSDGSYVDLNFNPYKKNSRARINKINYYSSILNNENSNIFSNSALVLTYMSSATFSATDYLNYKGTEASTKIYGSNENKAKTIGSYYNYANTLGDSLIDIENSYTPKDGKPRKDNSNSMQEGGYAQAIDDYRTKKENDTYTLKVSPQVAWRDRYIYGGKTSGENMDKYYSVAPSLEQIENDVGSNGSNQYGITTQSMFLMLSTIFSETGGKYHMDTPTRGAYDKIPSFDSNRSSYYVVSMLGTPFFTMFALVALPLIRLVVLLAVLTAVLSLGIIDMNIRPFMAYLKGLTTGSIEYCQALIIYVIGIGATIAMLMIVPELLILLISGVGELITLPAKFTNFTTISPQASLALEGVRHIISCFVAMIFGFLYIKSPSFRKQLIDAFAMPWSYACTAGDRLEIQASGGLGRRSKSERDRMRSKNKLNSVLDGANHSNESVFGAIDRWKNDTVKGIKNDLPFFNTSTDEVRDSIPELTKDESNSSTTNPTKTSEELARVGKTERMINTLKEMESNQQTPDVAKADILEAEKSIKDFYNDPTPENLDKAYRDLDILENSLDHEDDEDLSNLQNINEVREELTDLAKNYSIESGDAILETIVNPIEEVENMVTSVHNDQIIENNGLVKSDRENEEPFIAPITNPDGKVEEIRSSNSSGEDVSSTDKQQNENEVQSIAKEHIVSELKTVEEVSQESEKPAHSEVKNIVSTGTDTQNKETLLSSKNVDRTTVNESNVHNETNSQTHSETENRQTENISNETNHSVSQQKIENISDHHSKNEMTEIKQIEKSLGSLSRDEHFSKVLAELEQDQTTSDFKQSIEKMRYSFKQLSNEEIQTVDKEEFQAALTRMLNKKNKRKRKKK
ncbi:Histone acetyltransferase (MYST family) [Enterococcus mundtii]|nr:Histone acetyltransferase (MYST family) [Enterococcus mundtii]